jgi:hypothetical protein
LTSSEALSFLSWAEQPETQRTAAVNSMVMERLVLAGPGWHMVPVRNRFMERFIMFRYLWSGHPSNLAAANSFVVATAVLNSLFFVP